MSDTKRVVVLGCGMVGSAMARDLAARPGIRVTVADVRDESLARLDGTPQVSRRRADLSDPKVVGELAAEHDFVMGALPSVLGLRALRAIIDAGRDCCDVSFMAENALELDGLARQRGVAAVVDCGVAPGVSNMMAGFAESRLDPCQNVEIYVGGLPVVRTWPFDYKAGFAPYDVIEEYVRPARMVEHGRVVVKEALSEPELMEFPEVGTLEAFNTDGLRSLAHTLSAPFMKEKTLRYPGHIALMRAFRETGLFSKEPREVQGQTVRPLDVTAALLFPKWTYGPGEADLTVMRVIVEGGSGAGRTRYRWDLIDRYDPATGLRSMSRTTAFPATIVAGLMMEGVFRRPGVSAPERLGSEPGLLERILRELGERGVHYSSSVETVAPAGDQAGELVHPPA
jgi:lysine 6-dehydrogenase